MKKFLFTLVMFLSSLFVMAETEKGNMVTDTISLPEVSVTSLYRNSVNIGYMLDAKKLTDSNYGQEPSHLFRNMPNIFSFSDNGSEFGYGYYRIRGLDQTRINATLDGMPWNESEDYGAYFANSPDIMSSMHSIKVERGSSSTNNGTASSGGSISLESVNPITDTESYAYIGYGSLSTYKTSIVYNSGLIGKSAFHVKATQQETDGYRDYSGNKSRAFTLKYVYVPNGNHMFSFLSLNGRHHNGQAWLGSTKEELAKNKHANANSKDDEDDWTQSINILQYKGKLAENIILTGSAYLQYQKGWYNIDIDNYTVKMFDPTHTYITNTVYSYGLEHYQYGVNAATKMFFGNLKLTVGTNLMKYQRKHYMNDDLLEHMKNVPTTEYYSNTGKKNDFNTFVSASYTINKFTFSGNIQYRYVDFKYEDNMNSAMSFDADVNDTKWNFLNFGLNAEYALHNFDKLYARYAEVSREPTRSDMFGGNEMYVGGITTNKAERSRDIELGYEINTNKIKGNVNLYYMSFKNERVLTNEFGPNGLPLHETADKSYRMGAEVSADWNFYDGFHYDANFSLSKNKITSDTFNEKNHVLTPSFTLNNNIYYQGKNWKAGISSNYHSKMYIDQDNNYEMPEYLTFNIYGSYKYKRYELSAHVNNVFNRINYINAAMGATDLVWVRESGITAMGALKINF